MMLEITDYLYSFNDYVYHELNSFLIEKFGDVPLDAIRTNLVILKRDNRITIKDENHLKLDSGSRINASDIDNTYRDLSNLKIEAALTPQEKERMGRLKYGFPLTHLPNISKPIYEIGLRELAILDEGKKRQLKEAGYLDGLELSRLPAEKPLTQPKTEHKAPVKRNPIKSLWELINSNIVSQILSGLFVAYVVYKILGH